MAKSPIVSWFSWLISGFFTLSAAACSFFHFSHSFFTSGSGVLIVSKLCFNAYFFAPAPTSITCGVFCMMCFATEIGCAIPSRQPTEPQFDSQSMIHASKVTCPSRSGIPPIPTLLFVTSLSVCLAPASTASSEVPPDSSFFQPARFASCPWLQVEIIFGSPV
ncbi:hypothetical protein D3C86_1435490 [compost metagenome]